jgi:hypothetical protein
MLHREEQFFGDNVHEGQLEMDRSSQQFNLL